MSTLKDTMWADKYAPKTLDSYIYPTEEAKEQINHIVTSGNLPHLLLSGTQGTGKTTLAKLLIDILGITDYRIINASADSGIDTIRDKVIPFTRTAPLGSDYKILLMEEADRLTDDAQKALRAIMDNSKDTCRFIFTCNYVGKVIPALLSRCQHIHIETLDREAMESRVAEIIESEGISVADTEVFLSHIDAYYPDMRKVINSIQQSSVTRALNLPKKATSSDALDAWNAAWVQGNPERILQNVIGVDLSNFDAFYETMYLNAEKVAVMGGVEAPEAVVVIAEHLYRANFMANQEINLMACVYRLFTKE